MSKVFIYWDNSSIYAGAQQAAADREGEGVRHRLRLNFTNLLRLAHADRTLVKVVAVGFIPPELRAALRALEENKAAIDLQERGSFAAKDHAIDRALQIHMLRDTLDHDHAPGTAILLVGDPDGGGFRRDIGFRADIARMRGRGWGVEMLSWERGCGRKMKEWASENGTFIALDEFYESVTYLTPTAPDRPACDLNLTQRPGA